MSDKDKIEQSEQAQLYKTALELEYVVYEDLAKRKEQARTDSEWREHFAKNELITTDDILGVLYRIPAAELRLIKIAIDSHLRTISG